MKDEPFNALTREFEHETPKDYTFSAFSGIADTNPKSYTLTEFADAIGDGTFKMSTDQVRCATAKDERSRIKRGLPAFSISGLFRGGHEVSHLVTHSNLICMDFDPDSNPKLLEDTEGWRDTVAEDEFSLFPFISVSGHGIAVIVRIEGERHEDAFRNLEAYYYDKFGLTADPAPKSVASLRFPSCDFSAEINWNARVFKRYSLCKERETLLVTQTNSSSVPPDIPRQAEIHSALECLSPNDRTTWRDVGMAMKMESNSMEMFDIWDIWSKRTTQDNYDQIVNRKQWNSFKVGMSGGITMATVFGWARENDWDWSEPPVPQHIIDEWMAGAEEFTLEQEAKKKLQEAEAMPYTGEETIKSQFELRGISTMKHVRSDDPTVLLGADRFLERGASVVLSANTGIGKSSFVMQCGILWALGKPALGIPPNGRMKILLLQAENGEGDLSQARDGVIKGMLADGTISVDELHDIDEYFKVACVIGTDGAVLPINMITGAAVGNTLRKIKEGFDYDIPIVDNLFSYAGCAVSEQGELTEFLRNVLNPVITDLEVGLLMVHHGNKAVKGVDINNIDMAVAESTSNPSGSGEIGNWTRAMLEIVPLKVKGMYVLMSGKRGMRVGWTDSEGVRVNYKVIKHSTTGICWSGVTEEDLGSAEVAEEQSKPMSSRKERVDWAEVSELVCVEVIKSGLMTVKDAHMLGAKLGGGASIETVRKRLREMDYTVFLAEAGIEKKVIGLGQGKGTQAFFGTATKLRQKEMVLRQADQGELQVGNHQVGG